MSKRGIVDYLMESLGLNDPNDGKVEVGKLSQNVLVRLQLCTDNLDVLMEKDHEALDAKMDALVEAQKDAFFAMPEVIEIKAIKNAIWEDIYAELNITGDEKSALYDVHMPTGTLYKEVGVNALNKEGIRCDCGCNRLLTEEEVAERKQNT